MIKQLKSFGLAALTASTLLFSAAPQAQAKNYYCRDTDNGIGYCFAFTGYDAGRSLSRTSTATTVSAQRSTVSTATCSSAASTVSTEEA